MKFLPSNVVLLAFATQGIVCADHAQARWDHRQAESLSRLDNLGKEYYNDILSYRAPWSWDKLKPSSQVQVRTQAGSLNQKDFVFSQSALIRTDPAEPWALAFRDLRFDDHRYALEQSELSLSYKRDSQGLELSLLADAFGDKAYSDIGLGLGWKPDDDTHLVVNLWSVDTFYQDKKVDESERRSEALWSFDLGVTQRFDRLSFNISHSQDTPVHWTRPARDEVYKHAQQTSRLNLDFDDSTEAYYFAWDHDWLKESLGSLSFPVTPGLTHRRDTIEVGTRRDHGRSTSQVALWSLHSTSRYRGVNDNLIDESPADNPLLKDGRRTEFAAISTWHEPLNEISPHAQQWGLIANRIYEFEEEARIYTEIKLQWALDWAIGKQGRFLLGTTWDLDEIALSATKNESFQPWGGGYTQILINF